MRFENNWEKRFEKLSDDISDSIKDILSQHKLDFPKWRYLDNHQNLSVETKKLQFVLCVILEISDGYVDADFE